MRITPTCVGKAHARKKGGFMAWDHPHMCGESILSLRSTSTATGSPPHVWGKPICVIIACCNCGIPPHMCGESLLLRRRRCPGLGSPPHTWGPRKFSRIIARYKRITPTYVGTTQPFPRSRPTAGDHPHMCGESPFR